MSTKRPASDALAGPLEKKAKRQPPSFADALEMATIFVGEQQQKFVVHTAFLTYYSKYFEAALNGGFSETTTQTVHLQETAPSTFALFLDLLYWEKSYHSFQNSSDYVDTDSDTESGSHNRVSTDWWQFVDLWVLVDYLQAPKLQNVVTAMMQRKAHEVENDFCPEIASYAYDRSGRGSIIRRLCLAITYYQMNDTLTLDPDTYHHDFLFDMTNLLWINRRDLAADGEVGRELVDDEHFVIEED